VQILRGAGASVRSAGSVAEGLRDIGEQRPDVVVTDLAMPGEDGFVLVGAIRALEGPRIPVVALTAYASEEDARRVRSADFDDYLAKPVDPAALVRVVHRIAHSVRRG